jgi:Protein of unknown function (DUF3348)
LSRHFHRSRFIELLSHSSPAPLTAPRQDFAERLSLWLAPVDTIQLHALLQNTPASSQGPAMGTRQAVIAALNKAVQQARSQLTHHITRSDETTAVLSQDASLGYAPYRKRHLDLQRRMDTQITPLRAGVRQVLAKMSPTLSHLASLDALMEQALASREQKLLATAPLLLERRFEAMKKSADQDATLKSEGTQAPEWLKHFDREWQHHLLAELDVRLQPVLGLVESVGQEEESRA